MTVSDARGCHIVGYFSKVRLRSGHHVAPLSAIFAACSRVRRANSRYARPLVFPHQEKESSEDYNVACILTLPQFQRMVRSRYLHLGPCARPDFSFHRPRLFAKLRPLTLLYLPLFRRVVFLNPHPTGVRQAAD